MCGTVCIIYLAEVEHREARVWSLRARARTGKDSVTHCYGFEAKYVNSLEWIETSLVTLTLVSFLLYDGERTGDECRRDTK